MVKGPSSLRTKTPKFPNSIAPSSHGSGLKANIYRPHCNCNCYLELEPAPTGRRFQPRGRPGRLLGRFLSQQARGRGVHADVATAVRAEGLRNATVCPGAGEVRNGPTCFGIDYVRGRSPCDLQLQGRDIFSFMAFSCTGVCVTQGVHDHTSTQGSL